MTLIATIAAVITAAFAVWCLFIWIMLICSYIATGWEEVSKDISKVVEAESLTTIQTMCILFIFTAAAPVALIIGKGESNDPEK